MTQGVEEVDRPPTGDRVAGWVLFGGQAVLAVVLSYGGYLWWALVGFGCSDDSVEACDALDIEAVMGFFAIFPWVVLVGALVWLIVRLRRRQPIWWVPLVAGTVPVGVLVLGLVVHVLGLVLTSS
ncbi:hypothetical protein GCM10009718_07340 [Isoptericola halotolerans]|uniref:Membrane protein n=1 Tax=Isoptericola halotolerans TaxID=300560 RepID=A0ABX2A409_9MICO|nr:hypothetical protein [Isoptericola halotolerans]NOV96343.1 putative membrane protein [Isoptericola halotolerans]